MRSDSVPLGDYVYGVAWCICIFGFLVAVVTVFCTVIEWIMMEAMQDAVLFGQKQQKPVVNPYYAPTPALYQPMQYPTAGLPAPYYVGY